MSKSIKAYHLTKLRFLRDELQAKATEAKRKQLIADRAYEMEAKQEMQWEYEKRRATRLNPRYR